MELNKLNDYDRLMKSYKATDEKPDKLYSILPTVLEMAGDIHGKTVLDLGCGSGFFSRGFIEHGAGKVLGVDSSQEQISEAKKHGSRNAEYKVLDIFAEPLTDSDVINVPFVVNYAPTIGQLGEFLKKIKNALRPGGVALFVIDVPSDKDLKKYGARKIVEGSLADGNPMTIELFDQQGAPLVTLHAYYYSPDTFESELCLAGFSDVRQARPTISDEGREKLGAEYWEGYVEDPQLGYFTARV